MNRPIARIALALSLPILLAGCSSGHRPQPRLHAEWHPQRELLLKYDANHDGIVTRAEMEAGLRTDFAAADTNHNGCLEPDEVRAVNEARWKIYGSTASPLIDWTQGGCVTFGGFAATARSLFDEMDRDGDGQLTGEEMGVRGGQKPVPAGETTTSHRHRQENGRNDSGN
jgi:hypothetical protein